MFKYILLVNKKWVYYVINIYLFTGTKSWRDKKTGSWFIQKFTEVFKSHGQTKPWSEIRTKINKSISEKTEEIEGARWP